MAGATSRWRALPSRSSTRWRTRAPQRGPSRCQVSAQASPWRGGVVNRGVSCGWIGRVREPCGSARVARRSAGRSQRRLPRAGTTEVASTGAAGTSQRVLTTLTRRRPRVRLTISTSVLSRVDAECSAERSVVTARRRPWVHHHQPRRASSGAAATSRAASRACEPAPGCTTSAARGSLGDSFTSASMVPIWT
jgi:hypothetical protein